MCLMSSLAASQIVISSFYMHFNHRHHHYYMSVTPLMASLLSSAYPDSSSPSIAITSFCFHYFTPSSSKLFAQYGSLVKLSITHCDLRNLEHFPYLPELEELDLSNNGLQGGLNYLMKLSKLTYLNLSNNHISNLNKLLPVKKLEKCTVCVKGNPVLEDSAFKSKMKSHGIKIAKESREVCKDPKEENEKSKDKNKDKEREREEKEKEKEKQKIKQQRERERQKQRQRSRERRQRERIREREERDRRRIQSIYFRQRHTDRQQDRDSQRRNRQRQLRMLQREFCNLEHSTRQRSSLSQARALLQFNTDRLRPADPLEPQLQDVGQELFRRNDFMSRLNRNEGMINSLMRIRRQHEDNYGQVDNDDKSDENQEQEQSEGDAMNSEEQDEDLQLQGLQQNPNSSQDIQLFNALEMQPPSSRPHPSSDQLQIPSISNNSEELQQFHNIELQLQEIDSDQLSDSEEAGEGEAEERE